MTGRRAVAVHDAAVVIAQLLLRCHFSSSAVESVSLEAPERFEEAAAPSVLLPGTCSLGFAATTSNCCWSR